MSDIPFLPGWYTKPTLIALDDGFQITITPCAACGWPTIPAHTHKARPDARAIARSMQSRGCCDRCYHSLRHTPKWARFAPRQYVRGELLSEWALLHGAGESFEQAAKRLGLSPAGLKTALRRARLAEVAA